MPESLCRLFIQTKSPTRDYTDFVSKLTWKCRRHDELLDVSVDCKGDTTVQEPWYISRLRTANLHYTVTANHT